MTSIGRNETDKWIETLLSLSGADKELDKIMHTLEPQMQEFEQHTYPRLIELERWQRQLKRVRTTYSVEQREQLKTKGYAFLTPNQVSFILQLKLSNVKKLKNLMLYIRVVMLIFLIKALFLDVIGLQ